MKKIMNLFPVVTLEAIVDDHERINKQLLEEIAPLFADDIEKRVLSYKWYDFLVTKEKHQLGYTSFNTSSLTELPQFKFFYNHIRPLVSDFFAQLQYFEEWNFVNSWASVYPKGAWIPAHDHKPFEWSAAYYVKVHPGCGDIAFSDPKEYALQNEPGNTMYRGNCMHRITPQNGMLLMFPSYLKHETFPNESDEDRIIISFNIKTGPSGSIVCPD